MLWASATCMHLIKENNFVKFKLEEVVLGNIIFLSPALYFRCMTNYVKFINLKLKLNTG